MLPESKMSGAAGDSKTGAGETGGARGPGGREGASPPAPDAASSGGAGGGPVPVTEVSGIPGTLLDAIEGKNVPKPELMGYNAWISWRSGVGKRPSKAKDGVSTSSAKESELWKAVMKRYYGDDWRDELDRKDATEEEAAEAAEMKAEEEVPKTPPSRRSKSETGAHSLGSSLPNSPGEMRRKLFGADASKYSFEEFERKLIMIADGLTSANKPLSLDELQYVVQKAQYARTLQGVDPEEQKRVLKELVADLMLEKTDSPEKQSKMRVLMDMLRDRDGGAPSRGSVGGASTVTLVERTPYPQRRVLRRKQALRS